ncbi:hypothetical protein [Pseudomonas alcaligenes]|uniref:hypothetical protein n=1 Tax=Aquipseudomonas alcaligenes TaxID=43263 RepID=UPI00358F8017
MAKIIDYPRSSLQTCIQLAKAVDSFGGKCSPELAADKLGMKVSGNFNAIIASAAKFGLIDNKKGQLEVTGLYRQHKLAYSHEEANAALTQAFLSPPLFQKLYDRFKGLELPLGHFEKVLIREFSVPEPLGSRTVKYFLEGAKQCGILSENNVLLEIGASSQANRHNEDTEEEIYIDDAQEPERQLIESPKIGIDNTNKIEPSIDSQDPRAHEIFTIHIKGPGMDSKILINEEDDLIIVEAMLRKVKNKLGKPNQD